MRGLAGLGDANAVAVAALPPGAEIGSAHLVSSAPAADVNDPAGSGSGGLPLPILIVCALILIYAGARLVLGPIEPDLFRSKPIQLVRRAFYRA